MATKKKFKLKKRFRKYILFIIVILLLVFGGMKFYDTYKYRQTEHYKFIEIGYDDATIRLLEEKLSTKNR